MSDIKKNQKKKMSFPTAFTVLFILLILAAVLTHIVPAGSYSKLKYDDSIKKLTVTMLDGSTKDYEATQATLKQFKINVDISKFTEGSINKSVAIPEVIQAPIIGITGVVDVIVLVFIIGGIIGILNSSGAFGADFESLSRATKGREYLLIVVVKFLISLGGTTFGLAQETIGLYPILVPVFMIAALYMGSSIGTMFSTVNPFS